MTDPTPQQILQTPYFAPHKEESLETIGQFLFRQFHDVWKNLQFTSKLPVGNAMWESSVIHSLIKAGHLQGSHTPGGFLDHYDESAYARIMDSVFYLLKHGDYESFAIPPEPEDYYVIRMYDNSGSARHLYDFYAGGYTKVDAEKLADAENSAHGVTGWMVVHIPA